MKSRRTVAVVLCTAGMLAVLSLAAQTKPAHVHIPVVPARAEDVRSPEALVLADYECISGGVGVARQWGRDLALYDPHAYFVDMGTDPKTGAVVKQVMTPQEYADGGGARLVSGGFSERELAHVTHRFGNVATVLSSYESKSAASGKMVARGVNIYQTYFDGKRWWIASVVWDEERPGNPIPPELLPKR